MDTVTHCSLASRSQVLTQPCPAQGSTGGGGLVRHHAVPLYHQCAAAVWAMPHSTSVAADTRRRGVGTLTKNRFRQCSAGNHLPPTRRALPGRCWRRGSEQGLEGAAPGRDAASSTSAAGRSRQALCRRVAAAPPAADTGAAGKLLSDGTRPGRSSGSHLRPPSASSTGCIPMIDHEGIGLGDGWKQERPQAHCG